MKRPSTAGIGLLFAAPAMFGLFLFVIGPTLAVAVMSLTDWQLGASEVGFVGLDNYRALPGDRVFRTALANTLVYAGLVTPISVALGLGLALLIEASPLGRSFFRAAFFLPVVTTTVAMAVVWEFVLHPSLGPANLMLRALGFAPANFLGDAGSVLATLAAIGVWENAGFNMVLFLAGLKAIPRELYQAAAVDGADRAWERFWTVTFPLLGPTMLFVAVIALLRSFKVFEIVAAITQGGPRRGSEVLLFTIYQEGFSFFRIGHAAALTMVFLFGLLVLALFQIRLIGRRVHYA